MDAIIDVLVAPFASFKIRLFNIVGTRMSRLDDVLRIGE
jgi:hypothetical protein